MARDTGGSGYLHFLKLQASLFHSFKLGRGEIGPEKLERGRKKVFQSHAKKGEGGGKIFIGQSKYRIWNRKLTGRGRIKILRETLSKIQKSVAQDDFKRFAG